MGLSFFDRILVLVMPDDKGEVNMYKLTTENSFDGAHFLAEYDGKCRNIHGHRWRVLVEIQCENLRQDRQQREMCVDFANLKEDLKVETEKLDHAFIIEKDSLKQKTFEALMDENFEMVVVDFRPTAENFAKYFYDKMKAKGYNVSEVKIYETPNNCASYSE